MTLLSKRRNTRRCRSKSKRMRRRSRRSVRIKTRRSPRRYLDGGKSKDDGQVVKFFEDLLENDTSIIKPTILPKPMTKFYKEFFKTFQSVSVNIDINQIEKVAFKQNRSADMTNYIDRRIRNDVMNQMKQTFLYNTEIRRPIHIQISVDNSYETEKDIAKYLTMIVFWLNVVVQYADDNVCNKQPLSIIILLSSLKKKLPSVSCLKECEIRKPMVNTGYSVKCDHIVIYRREEWFKVFIHETFHNYTLDFFENTSNDVVPQLRKYFGIVKKLQVRLFEAYTESWARIMNALLLAYDNEKKSLDTFMKLADRNIQLERLNSYYQTCKILNYMNMSLDKLEHYNEETSNLSYYFFVSMLYSDYQEYIQWSYLNNASGRILQFDNDNSEEKQGKFKNFIIKKFESDTFKKNIKYFQTFFEKKPAKTTLTTYMKKSLLTRQV